MQWVGIAGAGRVACCPAVSGTSFTWDLGAVPPPSSSLLKSQLGFLLVFHNTPYLGVLWQGSCPACASHSMEFAGPAGAYHNPQGQFRMLFFFSFSSFTYLFIEGNISPAVKPGLQLPWKELAEGSQCCGK